MFYVQTLSCPDDASRASWLSEVLGCNAAWSCCVPLLFSELTDKCLDTKATTSRHMSLQVLLAAAGVACACMACGKTRTGRREWSSGSSDSSSQSAALVSHACHVHDRVCAWMTCGGNAAVGCLLTFRHASARLRHSLVSTAFSSDGESKCRE